ncbi:MAG: pentapeptide repeat-containing protein [Pseudomonadota bacterium]|nr:pentapeptide repeat-containing protein [Pseudomonadota bacterium]
MTQSLWYIRHENRIFGPFPAPQIEEALKSGEVSPDWDVSLNEIDWLSIADSGQFSGDKATFTAGDTEETASWRDQRKMARERWLNEGAGVTEIAHDPVQDAAVRNSVARDHIRTQALLQDEKTRRASPWVVFLALALLAGVGVTVWWGQRDRPIQTGIAQAINCAAGMNDGANWTGCVKRGYSQAGVKARNARLDKIQLDDAHLKGADLAYASLRSASLRNAELVNVSLTGADLTGADLTGADLTGADLSYAVLTAANLTGTRLNNAKLDKAAWSDGRVCAEGSLGECR